MVYSVDMKALSIRQPWAWFIVKGHKPVENRSTRFKFRGPFLVHASKSMTQGEYREACDLARSVGSPVPRLEDLQFGGIVGVSTVTNLIQVMAPSGWYQGPYGLTLQDSREVDFVPCKGRLGFWEAPQDVIEQIPCLRL